jgi:D-alanyl-lipoteichoic acid acyltransferase DltB (MBOAT superfamily)
MLFNSIEFLIFFPFVVILFFVIPHKFRWLLLLAASYYFYMCWKPEYIFLIIASTLIDYYAGLKMGAVESVRRKKKFLLLSLVSNLTLLFSFKYFNFFNNSARELFDRFNIFYDIPAFDILLPVGISFYTFQTLSYSIDIYRGHKEPEKHLGIFALYVAFFPQLVAGPIERSTRLLPQFFEKKSFDYQRVTDGLKLMLWGFFKKVVIADRLAFYVNEVYNNPADFYGFHIILATYFFAFQIYCDFSGYSDIAIGAAQVMGYELMQNFRRPYFAKSISEFWKRWHISLSTWFRDYLYISLGGNRVSIPRWYFNLFIVFVISGLWHGANWTFILWGALHGFYLIFSILTKDIRLQLAGKLGRFYSENIQKFVKVFITFHLVLFAWIFFRANSISDAFTLLNNMFILSDQQLLKLSLSLGWYELVIAVSAIMFLLIVHIMQRTIAIRNFVSKKPVWVRFAIYYIIIFSILIFGQFKETEFIYFQF